MNSTDGLGEKPIGGMLQWVVKKANIFCSLDGPSSSINKNRINQSWSHNASLFVKPITNNFHLPVLLGIFICLIRMFTISTVQSLKSILHIHTSTNVFIQRSLQSPCLNSSFFKINKSITSQPIQFKIQVNYLLHLEDNLSKRESPLPPQLSCCSLLVTDEWWKDHLTGQQSGCLAHSKTGDESCLGVFGWIFSRTPRVFSPSRNLYKTKQKRKHTCIIWIHSERLLTLWVCYRNTVCVGRWLKFYFIFLLNWQ